MTSHDDSLGAARGCLAGLLLEAQVVTAVWLGVQAVRALARLLGGG